MSHIPSTKQVSLSDALDSLSSAVDFFDQFNKAVNDVMGDDQSLETRIQGYAEFAALENDLSGLNASLSSFLGQTKTLINNFLSSRPLMVQDPTTDDGKKYVQVSCNGHGATLLDLANAINSPGSASFTLHFNLNGNGSFNKDATWLQGLTADLNGHVHTTVFPGGSTATVTYDNSTVSSGGTSVSYDHHSPSCSDSYNTGDATFGTDSIEKAGRVDVDSAGNAIDLKNTAEYQAVKNYAESVLN